MTFAEYGFTLEDYLTKELHLQLERGGRYVCCPLHDENTASFRIYEDEDTFYCFGCDKGGDVVKLHQYLAEREGRAMTYGVALKEVKKIVYKHTKNEKVLESSKAIRKKTDYEIDGNRVVARKIQPVARVKEEVKEVVQESPVVEKSTAPAVEEETVVKTVKKKVERSPLETLHIIQSIKSAMYERDNATAQRKLFLLENP